jgi:hypothetical protein
VHLSWDHCREHGLTTTGVVRVEVTDATRIPGGRDYVLVITVSNLAMISDSAAVPADTTSLIAPVHYTHTATSDHIVVSGAVFTSGQIAGDTGSSELYLDYLQDQAAQTYSLTLSGKVVSGVLGGEIDLATPEPFRGVIGEYPSAGRLSITGNANSMVELSEEGTAATDAAAVQASVDGNGDGATDASSNMNWSSVVAAQMFAPFADQVGIALAIP